MDSPPKYRAAGSIGRHGGRSPLSGSVSGETEDRDCGISTADFGSNQVVYPDEARDDRHVLDTASTVGDDAATGRAPQGASQEYLASPAVQRQQITGQFTGENHI